MAQYHVAILGATGLVGQHILQILEERQFPVKQLTLLASERTAGQQIMFQGEAITVKEATPDSFEGIDIVLASAGGAISKALVPEAVKRGAVVIDNTSYFRLDENVPLVVAGVNDEDLEDHQGIVANPNCSTAQLMPVFKALHELGSLQRVMVTTYQSVSGAGKKGMDELYDTTKEALSLEHPNQQQRHEVFQRPMSFNLIPHIDTFMENGYTKEEWKVIAESRKILHIQDLLITATAVRVPVFVGHSEAVIIDFERHVSPEEAKNALMEVPEIRVSENDEDYPTPRDSEGIDPVLVGRIRRDTSNPGSGLHFWVVADNLRIGAALNAVKIAEKLHEMDLVSIPEPVIESV